MRTETHENWHSTHQYWNHARSSTISARHCADKHIARRLAALTTDDRVRIMVQVCTPDSMRGIWVVHHNCIQLIRNAFTVLLGSATLRCNLRAKQLWVPATACEWVKALIWALTPQDCLVCWMDMYFNRMLHEYHPRRTEIGTNSDFASHITKRFASATGASIASLTGQINKPQQEISRRHH